MSDKILEVKGLSISYGGIRAVRELDFHVNRGEIVSLIGANGAGKSSTLRAISGLVKAESGSVKFESEEIVGKSPDLIVGKGITMVPEGRKIFPDLTVYENLKLGAYLRKDNIKEDLARCFELFPILEEREWQEGGTLSGGEQQMLAIGRAMMPKPKLLILDEPSLGLAPLIIKDIFNSLRRICDAGTTVLMVEQNARAALQIADYAYVMELGNIVMSGNSKDLLGDKRLIEAYLGG